MPATSTAKLSVQVLDFEDKRLLIQLACLICDFCSSSQRFACSFLQIPPRDGHPCRPANDSPCRVRRRLSLPSKSPLPGTRSRKRLSKSDSLSGGAIRMLQRSEYSNRNRSQEWIHCESTQRINTLVVAETVELPPTVRVPEYGCDAK